MNSRNAAGNKNNFTAMTNGVQLTTPTSISMINSFIIKNADTSFDYYYASMKKRGKVQSPGKPDVTGYSG